MDACEHAASLEGSRDFLLFLITPVNLSSVPVFDLVRLLFSNFVPSEAAGSVPVAGAWFLL